MTSVSLYRKVRNWADTKIVSIPVDAAEDLNLEAGTGVQVTIETLESEQVKG